MQQWGRTKVGNRGDPGAETLAHDREREESWSGEKPAFGDVARVTGGAWEDEGPPVVEAVRVRVQERKQKTVAEGEERVFGGPLVR